MYGLPTTRRKWNGWLSTRDIEMAKKVTIGDKSTEEINLEQRTWVVATYLPRLP